MLVTRPVRLAVAPVFAVLLATIAGAQAPTTTALTISSSSVAAGVAVTLTASVRDVSGPVPRGQVAFCDVSHVAACLPASANLLALASVTPAGVASAKVRTGVGGHPLVAHFIGIAGTQAEAPSTSAKQLLNITQAAGAIPTTTLLTSVAQASSAPGATLYNLAAAVTSPAGNPAPVGSVSFLATSPSTTRNVGTFALTPVAASLSLALQPFPGMANQGGPAVVADFNEDGTPDVALISTSPEDPALGVYVLAGVGDGTFASASASGLVTAAACTSTGYPCSVATGDFNGDGHVDLVTLEGTGHYSPSYTVQFAYGKGDGTFTAGATVKIGLASGDGQEQIFVGDFDGDGRADVLVNNGATYIDPSVTSAVALLLQQPDHSFAVSYPTNFGPQKLTLGNMIAVGDLNNDGKTDFATAAHPGAAEIFLSNGDGTFAGTVIGNPIPIPNNDYVNTLLLADFNGDGVPDAALLDAANNQAVVFLNNGHGSFTPGPVMEVYPPSPYPAGFQETQVMDVNGDGLADLLTVYQPGTGYVNGYYPVLGDALLSNGDGSFTSATATLPLLGNVFSDVVADLNGDGLPDLVGFGATNATGAVFEQGALLNGSVSGTATVTANSVLMPAGGSLLLVASYAAQGAFAGSVSASAAVTGSSVATTTVVSVAPATIMAGQPVTISAKISPHSANGFANDGEVVDFSSYGMNMAGTLQGGVATVSFPNLPVGTVNVFAGYPGDTVFQGSMGSSSVVVTTAAALPAAINGTYVFLLKGLLPPQDGPVLGVATIGYFTADGLGNITGGLQAVNSAGLFLANAPISGTYSIQANGIATLQIVGEQGISSSFNAVLSEINGGGVAQKLSLVGLGTQNILLAGDAFAQVTGAHFALTGTYTIALNGEISCTPDTCVTGASTTQGALIATETVTPGGADSGIGTGTENDAGVVSSLPGLQMGFTAPDAHGVFQLSLISPGSTAQEPRYFAGIFVSPTKALLMSVEPYNSSRLFSGTLNR